MFVHAVAADNYMSRHIAEPPWDLPRTDSSPVGAFTSSRDGFQRVQSRDAEEQIDLWGFFYTSSFHSLSPVSFICFLIFSSPSAFTFQTLHLLLSIPVYFLNSLLSLFSSFPTTLFPTSPSPPLPPYHLISFPVSFFYFQPHCLHSYLISLSPTSSHSSLPCRLLPYLSYTILLLFTSNLSFPSLPYFLSSPHLLSSLPLFPCLHLYLPYLLFSFLLLYLPIYFHMTLSVPTSLRPSLSWTFLLYLPVSFSISSLVALLPPPFLPYHLPSFSLFPQLSFPAL